MSGLEAVEVRLSELAINKDFRIDSPFHTTQLKQNVSLKYMRIGNCLLESQYGISRAMNEDGIGYPIYRMNEITNMLCDLHVDKCADISVNDFEKFRLNSGDVLFNRTNSYEWVGRTGVYYPNEISTPMIFASYLVRFVPDTTKIFAEYLTVFLSCKYGITELRRRARQSINQTNINPEEVKEIEIPVLSTSIQKWIQEQFHKAHLLRLDAEKFYTSAESFLLSALGLSDFEPSQDPIAIKTLSESLGTSGRLDAEYYQQKYEDLENALNTNHTVADLCHIHDSVFVPHKGNYRYIELANVGMFGNITGCTVAPFDELPTRARRLVKSGQVIVSSIEGSLSSCALITDDYDNALCSTGFYVIDSSVINSETLLVLFKSGAIQELLKRRCSGTILTSISKDTLEQMLLPFIDEKVQKRIFANVQRSFTLRRRSEHLLDIAKQAVEIAIEENETKALTFIENQNRCR